MIKLRRNGFPQDIEFSRDDISGTRRYLHCEPNSEDGWMDVGLNVRESLGLKNIRKVAEWLLAWVKAEEKRRRND